MVQQLNNEDDILDQKDEHNESIILYLKSFYDDNSPLLNSFFRLFQILGINDEQFIHETLLNIDKESSLYINSAEKVSKDNSNLININNHSKIKFDSCFYKDISDAYTNFCACYYYLNEAPHITVGDLEFLTESVDRIQSTLGRVFIQVMDNDSFIENFFKNDIHSLGGESRAKKYSGFKKEIFKEWKSGSFYSYAECARSFSEKHKLSTKTIESWLSKEFSKPQK
ncbi:MAG: hypothetical protein GAK29_03586 [Acinetobacter bereziniae]|uniref:Uncharacterized protein n=1 Tax=Acinetobacter bereziniae TaxID=106648 RepID=A0A833PD77_ACIBZ|nr:MAG: hypothetical protein GAK29_03586 [Acinetobacter bereziniae]